MRHHRGGAVNLLVRVARDEHVQRLVLVVIHTGFAVRALLDGTLAADGDPRVGLALHAFLRVAARADDQTDEVVPGVLLLRHPEFAPLLRRAPIRRRPEQMRTARHQPPDQIRALLAKLRLHPVFPGVGPRAVPIVLGRGGGRSFPLGTLIPEIPRLDALGHVDVSRVLTHHLRIVAIRGARAVHRADAVGSAQVSRAASRAGEPRGDAGEVRLDSLGGAPLDEREGASGGGVVVVAGGGFPAASALTRAALTVGGLGGRGGGLAVGSRGGVPPGRAEREGDVGGGGGVGRAGAGVGGGDDCGDTRANLRLGGVHVALALSDAVDVPGEGVRPVSDDGGFDDAHAQVRGEGDAGKEREAEGLLATVRGGVTARVGELHRDVRAPEACSARAGSCARRKRGESCIRPPRDPRPRAHDLRSREP